MGLEAFSGPGPWAPRTGVFSKLSSSFGYPSSSMCYNRCPRTDDRIRELPNSSTLSPKPTLRFYKESSRMEGLEIVFEGRLGPERLRVGE